MHRLAGLFAALAILCGSAHSPALAQDNNPQQQRVPASVTVADGSFTSWLGDPPSSTKRSDCSAVSAKDVVASKTWRDRCE